MDYLTVYSDHEITTADELRVQSVGDLALFIHRDHRWVLPLIHHAQKRGAIPKPANVAMFDAHHDALEPSCLDRISKIREAGPTTEILIDLCRQHLGSLDDD